MTSTPASQILPEIEAVTASDAQVFARLETVFGAKLSTVLQGYLETSDQLNIRLQDAASCAHWQEAVRAALVIGEEADEMGFYRVAKTARSFADAAYSEDQAHALRNGAQMVVFEYERFRLALEMRFPNHIASSLAFVA